MEKGFFSEGSKHGKDVTTAYSRANCLSGVGVSVRVGRGKFYEWKYET